MTLLAFLALLLCIGAGTIGGVFFAFSIFVMQALGQLPNAQGIAAMQRINVAVLNPRFLGVFLGTALLAGISMVAAIMFSAGLSSLLMFVGGLSYLFGTFGVTVLYNVPRNEKLARMEAHSKEAGDYWPTYVGEWTTWNHIRTLAALIAATCSAASLFLMA